MRAVILADASFASRERGMLSRLEVGLADEGVRVVHAIPRSASAWAPAGVFTQTALYDERFGSLGRRWRLARLVEVLEELAEGQRPADVVHVFGRGAWPLGLDLADELQTPLMLEIGDEAGARAAASLSREGDAGLVALACDEALAETVRLSGFPGPVRTVPWGVHAASEPGAILEEGRSLSMLMAGSGADPGSIEAMLEGFSAAAHRLGECMLFASSEAILAARLWPRVQALGLAGRVTLMPDMEARRELTVRGDVLILPERTQERRSLTLDAMGHGMLMLARRESTFGDVSEDAGILVDHGEATEWRDALCALVDKREECRARARVGWEHVRAEHRASTQVAGILAAYESSASPGTLPFGSGG